MALNNQQRVGGLVAGLLAESDGCEHHLVCTTSLAIHIHQPVNSIERVLRCRGGTIRGFTSLVNYRVVVVVFPIALTGSGYPTSP